MLRKKLALLVVAAMLPAAYVQSGTVDLATLPLVSGVSNSVAPNIYFILDDSTSMTYDYMPDSVGNNSRKACFRNFGYNTIYYNPAVTYAVPKNADGTDFPSTNTSFYQAKTNGFSSTSGTTDLSNTSSQTVTTPVTSNLGNNPFTTTRNSRNVTVSQPGHGLANGTTVTFTGAVRFNNVTLNGTYTINNVAANTYSIRAGNNANANGTGGGNAVVESHNTSVTIQVGNHGWYEYEANPTSPPSTCEGDGEYVWRWPSTDAEKLNYTNWYSYYRTRLLMMKSATGRAFSGVDNGFRVGYSAISEPGVAGTSTRFLKFDRFESTHRSTWYSRLYSAACPSSGTCFTPLRGALSKAGRIYAGKLLTGNNDPVQYSCQKNYTILTTDGYWNTSDETATYTAKRENNTTDIGDLDGVTGTARPFLDSGKYPNSLADIAMYYWKSDLRPAGTLGGLNEEGVRIDVSANDVPPSDEDSAVWQHMTTFTLGLGVNGVLAYDENYKTGGSPDYNAILQGTKNWPNPLTSPLSSSSTVTARIDDLWHAAVNGRGTYLSAGNPDTLVEALQKMLSAIEAEDASAAAAATSSLEPVTGDNRAYVAQYTTLSWHGDLVARDIDLVDGTLSADVVWSAKTRLAGKVAAGSDTRDIFTYSASGVGNLKPFLAANLTSEIAAGYFKSSSSNPGGALSQYGAMTTGQKAAATDAAMIEFLRGRTGFEKEAANADDNRLFRDRTHALGDIVNAAPVYVRRPPFKYTDTGYAAFLADQQNREATVYVGANDGMLHAFDAETGNERWAYIPGFVVPDLYKLADTAYADNHRFYVDGPITVGDAYDATANKWRTILIGGLGGGGKGFYALDVTDPEDPEALWEFGVAQDADMGYSYGNAVLTKRASDGKWVVLVASGYNNSSGDKKGRLYVLDAITGTKLQEIVPLASPANEDQSGIAKITNWVLDTLVDNSTQYVYGGDLGGSLWRFDISANSAQRLGKTSSTPGDQPITVRPEVARVKDSVGNYYRVVYFGTGRYLGFDDLTADAKSNTEPQAIYGVKDTGSDLGELSEVGANLVRQTVDASGDATGQPRTILNPATVNWQTQNGWFVEAPLGERLNVDPKLQLGTLVAISNKPINSYCIPDGKSWLWALDYRTGAPVQGQQEMAVGFPIGNSIATGVTLVRLPTNKLVAIVTQADTTVRAMPVPAAPGAAAGVRRLGWREIL